LFIRGRLGTTLAEVKARADRELAEARARKAAGLDEGLGSGLGGLLLGMADTQTGACCVNCRGNTGSIAQSSAKVADGLEDGAQLQYCVSCAPQSASATTEAAQAVSNASAEAGEEGLTSESAPPCNGSEVVFRNFRELLWYWQEYYLRRGRDRLSVEFSSHIPFRYWQSVVGEFILVNYRR
jgi:hypothetical protein